MDADFLKAAAKRALSRVPQFWDILRFYVRYTPRACVAPRVNATVNRFFEVNGRAFTARTTCGFAVSGDALDLVQRYIYLYGVWEPNLTHWISGSLKPGDVFIDVGANIGYFSLLASRLVGHAGQVVAVEASPSIFRRLGHNLEQNRANNVRALNIAASETRGELRLFRAPTSNLGASSIFREEGFEDEGVVEARPLPEILTREEYERARMIKIDVEGAEQSVVGGLLPLLGSGRQDLEFVIEIGGGPREAPSAAESAAAIVPAFARDGFNAYHISNEYTPESYIRPQKPARPQRVLDVKSLSKACDLVFSRRDVARL